MANGYDDEELQGQEEWRKRDKVLANLSTIDRIKYNKYERDYEIERQSGGEVPEDKHQYILSKIFKNKSR